MAIKQVIIGFIIGVIIGFLIFAYTPLGNRYKMVSGPRGLSFKIDKWTGKSWRCLTECMEQKNE